MNDSNLLRLMAVMLADIHDKVGADLSGIDSKLVCTLLSNRQEWALSWKYDHLLEREDNEVVTHVVRVLDMWRSIEDSYDALDDVGKAEVRERSERSRDSGPRFEGFDGNYEGAYRAVAMTLIDDLGLWEEFAGRRLNTHAPTHHIYGPMLNAYDDYLAAVRVAEFRRMTVEDLVTVLNAPFA